MTSGAIGQKPDVDAVGVTLVVVGAVGVVVGFVGSLAVVARAASYNEEVRRLRSRYGLDRRRWAEIRRSVHRGARSPEPLRPAAAAYAELLLVTPGYGVGNRWQLLLMGALALQIAGSLVQQLSEHRVFWLNLVALVAVAGLLVGVAVLRRRRPARAAAVLAADR